jgi:hypothetical protein
MIGRSCIPITRWEPIGTEKSVKRRVLTAVPRMNRSLLKNPSLILVRPLLLEEGDLRAEKRWVFT